MIKVTDLAEKIKNNCFTDEEKQILEFSINNRVIDISKQIKFYFKNCCYRHTEEELFDAIIMVKEDNKDLLKQIANYQITIKTALNPLAYQNLKTSRINRDDIRGAMSQNSSNTTTNNKSKTDTVANDFSQSGELNKGRSATSEVNQVSNLKEVWDEWAVRQPGRLLKQVKDAPREEIFTVEEKLLDSRNGNSGEYKDLPYQHFEAQENLNTNQTDSHNNTTSGSKALAKTETKGDTTHSSIVNSAKNVVTTELGLGDATLQTAEIELPKYRQRFWEKFRQLFLVMYR